MPVREAALTPTEVLLAREACEPLLKCVTDRLLRSGLAGFVEFRQRYVVECQRAVSAAGKRPATPSTPAASSPFSPSPSAENVKEARPRVARRINPEGLKGVFSQSGVLFSPDEYRSILVAYSDAVGFVLAEDLLADLHPCRHAPLDVIHASTRAVAEGLFADLPVAEATDAAGGASQGEADFLAVTVDGVCAALRAVFDPSLSEEEEAKEASTSSSSSCATALASLQAGVDATFITALYPDSAVPAEDVVAFVVLALHQHPSVASLVLTRLGQAPALKAALPSSSRGAIQIGSTASIASATQSGALDGSALFRIRHRGVTTQRKFEYYSDNVDRRDEWMRGRREADARPVYMRHAVGYGGHLPGYQYHFGRTFHVIEEDLPQLTQPKAPLEPVPADWYGAGVELKDSRMNAHHYQLA